MARITRKELKTDKFALEVGQTVTFFEEHQKAVIRYGGAALAIIVVAFLYWTYRQHQQSAREAVLAKAIQLQETVVSTQPSQNGAPTFPTQEIKNQATTKAFGDLSRQYPGTAEGEVAQYYLGAIKADEGKLAEAEKYFLDVAQKGGDRYAALAKLSLAQVYFSDGRDSQGEKTLRDLMAHPTVFVSSEQAALTLARYLMIKNPAEARKLLDPLRNRQGAVGQTALTLYGELPPQ